MTFDLVARTLDEQIDWLDEHSGGHPAIVAVDDDGAVVGFGSLSPWRPRPAYSPTVEDSVYVHHDRRGEGIGRLLLEELVRLAEAHGFHSIMARIVGGHEASIALHARVWIRGRRRRARGRPQVREVARRRADAADALSRRSAHGIRRGERHQPCRRAEPHAFGSYERAERLASPRRRARSTLSGVGTGEEALPHPALDEERDRRVDVEAATEQQRLVDIVDLDARRSPRR